jgi:hypothetical protein
MTRSAPSSKATARAGAPSPSPRKRRAAVDDDGEDLNRQRKREREDAARRSLQQSLIWIGGATVVLTIGGIWWWTSSQRAEAERAARAEAYAALRTELLAPSGLEPAKAGALLQRIEATTEQWQGGLDADAIQRQASQAKAVLANHALANTVGAELTTLQQELTAPDKSAAAWQGRRERARALQAKVAKTPGELQTSARTLLATVDVEYFNALVAAGDSATASDAKAALASFTAALDLATDATETGKDRAAQAPWQQRRRDLLARYDGAAKAALGGAASGEPAPELRSTEADWVTGNTGTVTRTMQGDAVVLACPGGDKAKSGVVVLRHHSWHACELSLEVELTGKATLFARTHGALGDKGAGGLVLATTAAPGAVVVPAGKPVHVALRVVGKEVVATVDGGDPQRAELTVSNDERRGAIAAVLQPDTKLTLRQLRVRKLG